MSCTENLLCEICKDENWERHGASSLSRASSHSHMDFKQPNISVMIVLLMWLMEHKCCFFFFQPINRYP